MDKTNVVISPDYLNCGICLQIATAAIETNCCHNIYCESCIADCKAAGKGCPSCRKANFETPACMLARRMINTLPAECPFGCGTCLIRGNLEQHKKRCSKRVYNCAKKGCSFKGTSEEYAAHISKGHYEDLIEAFEGLELKRKFTKKGTISGYYKQGGEHPINGTFRMENGKFVIHSNDEVGAAIWEGNVDFDSLNVRIIKKYTGKHSVEYRGRINEELTEIEGKWYIGGYGDDFKLILTEQVEEKKKVSKKGTVSGYYKQGGEHPIEGSFRLEEGRFLMSSKDEVGEATWEGSVDLETLSVRIIKKYTGQHGVEYTGRINEDLTVIEGKWHIGKANDDFKLVLAEGSRKVSKRGIISGHYVQGGEQPIDGVFRLEGGKFVMNSKDTVGEATWEGDIDLETLDVTIKKQYHGRHSVQYKGKINYALTVIQGKWSIGSLSDNFKLVLTEGSRKVAKKGAVSGFYKQFNSEHPIEGTFELKDGKFVMKSQDEVGAATWEGDIDLETLSVNIKKQYNGAHGVEYTGKINYDLTTMVGKWRIGGASDGFKLVLTEQEDKKKVSKKGGLSGHYVQGEEEHPIDGSYELKDGKLVINSQDEVGAATWEGDIDFETLNITIKKQYHCQHSVQYIGKINDDLTVIEGRWDIEGYGDNFKLVLGARKVTKREGAVSGYYKQFGSEHPIEGTFDLKDGKFVMNSQDEVGAATWEGDINLQTLNVTIKKQYHGQHSVEYKGKINDELTVIEGKWRIGPCGDDFKLVLTQKVSKKGTVAGYYVQGGQHLIEGSFKLEGGKFVMGSQDEVGAATWEGDIDLQTLKVNIKKQYTGQHAVEYTGKINDELTIIEGKWAIGAYGDDFKLVLNQETRKVSKKGAVSGYYVQGGEHPIEGNFTLENGKLVITSEDEVGAATWEGDINLETLDVTIKKQYNGQHAVEYTGKINEGLTVIEGKWSIGGYGDDFKLVLAQKVSKKGTVTGYYVQGGQHPIEGSFKLEDGKFVMNSQDEVGEATWEGVVDLETLSVNIKKQYNGQHSVEYTGKITDDLTVIEGKWSIGGYGDDFKLVLTEQSE